MTSDIPDFLRVDDGAICTDGGEAVDPRPRPRTPGLPAEAGLWVFVLGDMTVFGWFFVVFMWERRNDRALFAESGEQLFPGIGVTNAVILLISSLLVVLAVHAHRRERAADAARVLIGAGACAALFAVLKAVEYSVEIDDGHTPAENTFFLFYFMLTGIHLLHVLIGAGLLFAWFRTARTGRDWPRTRNFAEAAAVYWHMVDLLWIVIFTLLYLVGAS